MVDTYTLEGELIAYIAPILQINQPDEIHRGFVPEGISCGIGLSVVRREDTGDYDVRQNVRSVIVSGKFETRRDAMDFIDRLDLAFPAYGVRLESAFCHSIEPDEETGEPPRQATENGTRRWFASYVLHVSAC